MKLASGNQTRNRNDALFPSDLRANIQTFNLYNPEKDCPYLYQIPLKPLKNINPLTNEECIIVRPDL